ncbi:YMGG-like glycine zipper-containing protein [Sphingomicrobium clamense]|uniref:YMGG-like Gly-zipper domain-containing protein n=1 Tax=Sphingomicrobium clamense TaxID=2851013 RepID=A0ABS6V6C6_9SPHN|nr:YMGG-like glycine zipper-containing protein [Sphingomicrobium sp. B8]MBW0145127.1 hypothetical protein [Sphingomicrobium sp. B8]
MRKFAIMAATATGLTLTACAQDRYGYGDPYRDTQTERAVKGAAIGAAAGAVAGAVIPGVSTVEGAAAGAVLGGVAGAVIKGKQYYRDTRGYCYYVDDNGNPVYDYDVRC